MVCKIIRNHLNKKQVHTDEYERRLKIVITGLEKIFFLSTCKIIPQAVFFPVKALTLGGSHKINQFSSNSLYGDLSAILIENAPFWVEMIRTPKQKIALLEDFEKKLELITKATINENVTSISGVPSWYLVLIKQILAYTGKSNLLDVWPNLEVFFHGGISFTPYREHYKKLISGRPDELHGNLSTLLKVFSEYRMIPRLTDMLLMLDYGIFYEFIPADKIEAILLRHTHWEK